MSVSVVGNEYELSGRRMSMNKDILKGKLLEIRGGGKEKWGKLTDNYLGEIEGKSLKLSGLLQKKYGYIRDKTELEYKDSVELAEIVSSIRQVMTKKKDARAIAFIARYGQPLLTKKQESQITKRGRKTWVIEVARKLGYDPQKPAELNKYINDTYQKMIYGIVDPEVWTVP
jgi:uncharacterized protein YjbJ (UPF0337 family)